MRGGLSGEGCQGRVVRGEVSDLMRTGIEVGSFVHDVFRVGLRNVYMIHVVSI